MARHFLEELRTTFAQNAARPALAHQDKTLTYGHLELRARRCAGWLQAMGIEAGDRVLLCTPEKRSFLAAHLGALFAGAVSLPMNPGATGDELKYVLADSGAKIAIVADAQRATVEALRPHLPELKVVAAAEEAWGAAGVSYHEPDTGPDDPCLMLYSSGTTGRPKGVVHTNANLASSLHGLRDCWRFSTNDVLVNALPLFHIHGLSFATHLCLLTGGCMRMEDTFHPRRTLEAIGLGTVFMAIPTFYYALLERPEFRELAQSWQNVRLFTCGSAPIRPEVLLELEAILGRPVINRYGMTEGHVITSLPLTGPWPVGSVGLPLAGVEVRVVDEAGADAVSGAVGSVQLRGPNLFREYWRNPEATRAAFASGWFDTGDLGTQDEGGFLTLVGRKHDLIITNGLNVYPQVVERVMNECPGVRESAVLGVPDPRRGERVVAVVVRSDPTLDDLRLKRHLSEHLVAYQRPSSVIFVDALPRNAMGKVLRRELRTWFVPSDASAGS
ncbi:MAG TPA: class I adenylate-forming enzyme family protein [Isosphaeraceae bacterium]|jgi:malonyl-CoA/methylmalonyl-CoA synthetase|nr:class I adenylate-forming enzyme family protein [Isosphaeraceae bacterium]